MRASLFFFALLLATLTHADAGWAREWRVERVSGTAWTIESVEKRNILAVGMMVPEGLTIATAKSGRVRLSSENNVMTLGPGSVAVVQPKGRSSSKTEVLQRVGSIAFDIERRSSPHFTVHTPFMAAVVKGTAFTISVSKTDTKIGVDRGLVQVSDLRTGETAGIGAGQFASVSADAPGLATAGIDAPQVAPGKPSAPNVAPLGQTLSTARETHAMQAARSSEASTGGVAGAGLSRSVGASDAGGFGGDNSDARDRAGVGTAVSHNGEAGADTQDHAVGRDVQGEGPGEPAGGDLDNRDAPGTGVVGDRESNGDGGPSGSEGGRDVAGNPGETVGSRGGDDTPGRHGGGGNVANTVGNIGNDTPGGTPGRGTIGGTVGNTVDSIGNTIGNTLGGVGNTIGSIGNTIGNGSPGGSGGGGSIAGTVGNTLGGIGNTIGSIGNTIGNGGPGGSGGGGSIAGTIGNTLGGIGNTLGGIGKGIGGLGGGGIGFGGLSAEESSGTSHDGGFDW